jgi:integrase/recombinase XerD
LSSASSCRLTVPNSGKPIPKSHRPHYVERSVMLSGRRNHPPNQELGPISLTIIGIFQSSDDEGSMTMVEQVSNVSAPKAGGSAWPLVAEFLDHLRRAGVAKGGIQDFPGPAKHFLVWAGINAIPIGDIDIGIVRQFLAHDCACPRPHGERYQHRHMATRAFRTRVLRFVRFLEETGRIDNPVSPDEGPRRVAEFTTYLAEQGYAPGTIISYGRSCRHFVAWLHLHRIDFPAIDNEVLERFAIHDCICPGMFVQNAKRDYQYQIKIRVFLRFLASVGVMPRSAPSGDQEHSGLRPFRDWLCRHRGCTERRSLVHVHTIRKLLPQLGEDPSRYEAALINRVILQNLESTSRASAQVMCGALRMYLRFLAATGACSPGLVGAIPRIPRWRLATLPRYILNDDVERVIASCDPAAPRGLRDRAIILLLARLALRAGDVANLNLDDIDWDNGLIRVAGKTRYSVALPLPQDAGDALLAYIERGRPIVDSIKVFIRTIAPFVPFATSSAISIVVRDALLRAGVDNANLRGAYLLRHSAATNMLRSGATLDAVGALLRHRSPETTAIYAKVDTTMLAQVAQPWIGGAA